MDYTQYIIPLGIIIYAIFVYHRREQLHRERLELLKRDIEPKETQRGPDISKIIFTAFVAVLLVGMCVLFIGLRFTPMTLIYFILLLLLILMLKRDIKAYRNANKQKELI
ncbi:MAG: hypothetical protein C0417_04015 [Chlorobiaceae bacterium]|nr:hypothetical protein [Chlorobiaceae bacterium]